MPNVVMLVEDEPLIALDLEAQLEELGYEVAGPFRNRVAAEAWLIDASPVVAVVDYTLSDGPCDDLLLELKARDVFTVVLSAHTEAGIRPEISSLHLWLLKPISPKALREAVAEFRTDRLNAKDCPKAGVTCSEENSDKSDR